MGALDNLIAGNSSGAVAPQNSAAPAAASNLDALIAGKPFSPVATPKAAAAPSTKVLPFNLGGYRASKNVDPVSKKPLATVPVTIPKTFMSPATTISEEDTTRVAPTFDPTKAQKVDPSTLQNGKHDPSFQSAMRKELGATAFEELDHVMPLELGGSNVKLNLKPEPGKDTSKPYNPATNPTATDPLENSIANKVHNGDVTGYSLLDGWREMAKAKGVTLKEDSAKNGPLDDYLLNHPNTLLPLAGAQDAITGAASKVGGFFKGLFTNPKQTITDAFSKKSTDSLFNELGGQTIVHPIKALNGIIDSAKKSADTTLSNLAHSAAQVVVNGEAAQKDPTLMNSPRNAAAILNLLSSAAATVFYPVSQTFEIASQLPVIKPAADAVGLIFKTSGQVGGFAANALLDRLPLSQEWKDKLQAPIESVGTLVGQIALGGTIYGKIAGGMDPAQVESEARSQAADLNHTDAWNKLGRPATMEEAAANYRRMAMEAHPDKPGGSTQAMSDLNVAYDTLKENGIPSAKLRGMAPQAAPKIAGELGNGEESTTEAAPEPQSKTPALDKLVEPEKPLSSDKTQIVNTPETHPADADLTRESQKYMAAFRASGNQEVMGTLGKREFALGDMGRNHITAPKTSKTEAGSTDRLTPAEIKETIPHMKEVYNGSKDITNHRSNTAAWIAKMPDGEQRVVYTKLNAMGQEEITGAHKVNEKENPNFVRDLKSRGTPSQIRTGMTGLEGAASFPLNERGTKSLAPKEKAVKPTGKRIKKPVEAPKPTLTAEDHTVLEKYRDIYKGIMELEDKKSLDQEDAIEKYATEHKLSPRQKLFIEEHRMYLAPGYVETPEKFADHYADHAKHLGDIEKEPNKFPPEELRFEPVEGNIEEEKNLAIDKGDYYIDRDGKLMVATTGNLEDIKEGGFAAENNAGYIRGKSPFDKSDSDHIDYTNQMRMATADELKQSGIEGAKVKPDKFVSTAEEKPEKTQKEAVVEQVKEEPKSIKEIAEATKILEPNVRRILGVGAKDGTFKRLDKGVYVLDDGEGKRMAYVEAGDAKDVLARMAKEGEQFHSVILDPAYFSKALIGGNRGIKAWSFILPADFADVMKSISKLVADDKSHVYLMLSGAPTAQKDMAKYVDGAVNAGFKPVGEGSYTKLTKDGKRVTNVRGLPAAPERIILLTKSGEAKDGEISTDLNFQFVRPAIAKSYATEKPAELMRALIERSTLDGEKVLDPFAGSGVTGEQAIATGRKPTLIEKNEEVVKNTIVPRLEKAVPKKGSFAALKKAIVEPRKESGLDKKEGNELFASKSRFKNAEDLIKEIMRPKYGEQGLKLNRAEAKQLVDHLVEKNDDLSKKERGIVYKVWGNSNRYRDVILGHTDIGMGGKIVAEIGEDDNLNGRVRIHGTALDQKSVIARLGANELSALGDGKKVPPKKIDQEEPVVPQTRNWREGYEKAKDVFAKSDYLKAIANGKSTAGELSDVMDRLEKITDELGQSAAEVAYDVSQNPAVSAATKERAETLREELLKPSSVTENPKRETAGTSKNPVKWGIFDEAAPGQNVIVKFEPFVVAAQNAGSFAKFIRGVYKVPIKDLIGNTSEYVLSPGISRNPHEPLEVTPPVQNSDGKKFIVNDGNHRLRDAKARGEKFINVRIAYDSTSYWANIRDFYNEATDESETGITQKPYKPVKLSSGFDPGLDKFINEDVKPTLQGAGEGFVKFLKEAQHLLAPKSGVDRNTLDLVFKMKGARDKAEAMLDLATQKIEKTFDKMPQDQQVAFIDRVKRGMPQPTIELQAVADLIRKTDDATYAEVQKYKPGAVWKDNHYRVLWKTVPGMPEKKGFTGLFRKPLQGSRGFLKKSTLVDMSEGLEKGGVPYSYNPMTMFKNSYADQMRFITAQRMWEAFKENGLRKFVPQGQPAPEGFTRIDDAISNTYFKAETASGGSVIAKSGEWYVEEGAARLLNNFLSRDLIRGSALGRGLMAVKNTTTAVELSLSAFHFTFETIETASSKMALGIREAYNIGLLQKNPSMFIKGIKDMLTSALSPGSTFKIGRKFLAMVRDAEGFRNSPEGKKFLEQFPSAEDYIDDFFNGGGKLRMAKDYEINMMKSFTQNLESGNYVGAVLRAAPAAIKASMKPLFETYIPGLKMGMFTQEFPVRLQEKAADLINGKTTRAQLARETIDFIDNRLGEMNFDNLMWNRTMKTGLQFLFRSVTWKYGTVKAVGNNAVLEQTRELLSAWRDGRAPQVSTGMAWLISLAIYTALISTIAMKMLTGKYPSTIKDLTYPQSDPSDPSKRLAIATYMKDFYSMAHSPVGYFQSSMSSEIGKMLELWNNRDFYGTEIYNPNDPFSTKTLYGALHMVPVPFSISSFQAASTPQQKALGFMGFTQAPAYVRNDPLQQKIFDLYQTRFSGGTQSQESAAAAKAKADIRQAYYDNNDTKANALLQQAIADGYITQKGAATFIKDADKPGDVRAFARFDSVDQGTLLRDMTVDELERYAWEAKPDIQQNLGDLSANAKQFVDLVNSGKLTQPTWIRGKQQ